MGLNLINSFWQSVFFDFVVIAAHTFKSKFLEIFGIDTTLNHSLSFNLNWNDLAT